MEFEKDSLISDEARILAQNKKLVLQPADPFLKPNDTPSPITINETHANIARDSELTTRTSLQPSAEQLSAPSALKASVIVAISLLVGIAGGASYFMFIG